MIVQSYLQFSIVFNFSSLQTLRLLLSLTLVFSAVSMMRVIPYINDRYVPNCWYIVYWSVFNAALMVCLAVGTQDVLVFQILNGSSIFLLGGWGVLMFRVASDLRKVAKHPLRQGDKTHV